MLMVDSKGIFYLLANVQERIFLLSWDGQRWSDPQNQEMLYSFQDPEVYSIIEFRCRQADLNSQDQLYVAGCDTGGGGDVWITSRSLSDSGSWYSPEEIWSAPEQFATVENGISSLLMLAEPPERFHVFWSHSESVAEDQIPSSKGDTISYAVWDQQNWSVPIAILRSPTGTADDLDADVDDRGRLYTVWTGGLVSGEVYFSWANSAKAGIPSEWSAPRLLSNPDVHSVSADIHVDGAGVVSVVYAIPVNEGRGIYLTQSKDQGVNWSPPIQVFDGVAAGWGLVDKPHITSTENGVYHAIWSSALLDSNDLSLGLYYARSDDSGATWSEPSRVTEDQIFWSSLVAVGEEYVHRLWEQAVQSPDTIDHQNTQDGGMNWNNSNILLTSAGLGVSGLSADVAGQVHLVRALLADLEEPMIDYWLWQGDRWVNDEGLKVDLELTTRVNKLAVAVSPSGTLALVYSGPAEVEADEPPEDALVFSFRSLQLPPALPTAEAIPIPTATPLPSATPTLAPTATPAIKINVNPDTPGSSSLPLDPSMLALIFGGVIAAVMVVAAIIVRLLRNR
jgi:hypothetical protein